jgi:hypothetical protein
MTLFYKPCIPSGYNPTLNQSAIFIDNPKPTTHRKHRDGKRPTPAFGIFNYFLYPGMTKQCSDETLYFDKWEK